MQQRLGFVTVRALIAALLIAAGLSLPARAATRYDPRLRFRTIATQRFTIYFHQGEEALARRLAAIAEEVASGLAPGLGAANGRVHVILVAQNDLSNGWATAAPYNVIEITAAAPGSESLLGNTDDWLRLVFAHEYTHIVHLDKARGWIGGLRRVFGRAPLLYPNLFLPSWQIEGIATYSESAITKAGRVPAGDFRAILDRAAAARRFEPLDRASGGLVDWPAGTAPYVYGAYFHQYLANRYGPDSIARLADDTAGRLPYFGVRAFRTVFGRSLGDLWNDFEADTRRTADAERSGRVRLTHHGFSVRGPAFSREGRLFYSVVNPHGFPALMELPKDGAPRHVADRYLGNRIAAAGNLLVFDQMEYVNRVGLQSDLYAVAADGGPVSRLTEQARAADPDISPDGRTIACTVQSADRRSLATMALPAPGQTGAPAVLLGDEATDYSSPRWSPDGRSIAAERRRVGGPSEIVVVDATTREVRTVVSSADSRNVTPFWLTGQTILFAADRDGEPFGIHAVDLATGAVRQLSEAGLSAQSPVVSPDGQDLVFVGYTADGYDLFSLPLASAVWTEDLARTASSPTLVVPTTAPGALADAAYRPWPTLRPQYWTPIAESDNGEVSAGAATAGMDALGRHAYGAALAWTATRWRPDWSIGYAYDRWWPTLFASVADDTDPWRDGEVRTRELNVGALFVAPQVRRIHTVLTAFNASSDAFDCADCGIPGGESVIRRGAVRLGWSLDTTRSYGYSVSRESGTAMRATWEAAPQSFGSEAGSAALTVDVRTYYPTGPGHAVVAVRAAGASAWGDERARRVFSAAGAGPASGGFDFGADAIGLIRGLERDAIVGEQAAVANVDYRVPLWTVERGVGTVPVFFRTIHGALFADAGHAWSGSFRGSDVRLSVGAELSLDAVLGYAFPVTFTTGVAWRDTPASAERGVTLFGRIGRAF